MELLGIEQTWLKDKHNHLCARAGDDLSLFMGSGFYTSEVSRKTFIEDFKYNGVAIH